MFAFIDPLTFCLAIEQATAYKTKKGSQPDLEARTTSAADEGLKKTAKASRKPLKAESSMPSGPERQGVFDGSSSVSGLRDPLVLLSPDPESQVPTSETPPSTPRQNPLGASLRPDDSLLPRFQSDGNPFPQPDIAARKAARITPSKIKSSSAIAVLASLGMWILRCVVVILAVATLFPAVQMYHRKKEIDRLQNTLRNDLARASFIVLQKFGNDRQWPECSPKLKPYLETIKQICSAKYPEPSPDENMHKRLEEFYRAYNSIYKSKEYQNSDPDCPLRRCMEQLAVVLVEEINGMEAYVHFAEEIIGTEPIPTDFQGLAKCLSSTLGSPKHFKRDSIWQTLVWAF